MKKTLASRTFWTVVVLVVINSVNANTQFLPAGLDTIISAVLGIIATYFHLNPSQSYTTPTNS